MLSATSVSGLLTLRWFFTKVKKDKNKVIGNAHSHVNSPAALCFPRINTTKTEQCSN